MIRTQVVSAYCLLCLKAKETLMLWLHVK